MAKLGRIILIVLLILVALVILAVIFVETRWAREKLEDVISQRLDGREVNIGELNIDWGWPTRIEATDLKIANADWAKHELMISVAKLDTTLKIAPLFRGEVSLAKVDLLRPQVHLARRENGTSNWDVFVSDDDKTDKTDKPPVQPDIIRIHNGELTYRDEVLDANISVTVETEAAAQQRRLHITSVGRFQGRAFKLNAEGGAPSEALEKNTGYPVHIEFSLGEMQLSFEGESLNIYKLEALHGELKFSAPDQAQLTQLSSLIDQPGLLIPPLEMRAELSHEDKRWALKNIQARLGSNQLSGATAVRMTETPRFEIELDSERLDLNEFGIAQMLSHKRKRNREHGTQPGKGPAGDKKRSEQRGAQQASWESRVADTLAPLREFEGSVDVQVKQLILGEARLDQLIMKGSLAAGRLQVDELHAAQGAGTLDAKGWVDAQRNTFRADLTADFNRVNLGQALQPFGLEQLGIVDGKLHGAFDGDALRISDTQLSYDKPEYGLHFRAQIVSRAVPDTEAPGLHIDGHGTRHDENFRLKLTMGPLLDLKTKDRPYPVAGTLVSGKTEATIDGSIVQPLELKAFDIQFDIAGANLAQLNTVTGLSLPALLQYQASGRMRLEDKQLRVTDLQASIGESDLSGDVRLEFDSRTMLWATLHSNQLNTRHLRSLAGSTDTVNEQNLASEGQKVFDPEPLDLQILARLDAELIYRADNLIAKDIPMSNVVLEASLNQGILRVKPLRVGLGGGKVSIEGKVNAGEAALRGTMDLSMKRVNLSPLLISADLQQVAQDSAGILGGKGSLSFEGESIAALMADLNGTVEVAMSGGYLDALAVELVGLDAGEALISAVSDVQRVPLRCLYIKAVADSGLVTMENFYINTGDTNITGGGTINLATEQLDLVIKSHAKDFSLLAIDTPVKLEGSLANPAVEVVDGSLIAKGVASLVGVLVAPPLAILPWVEPGTGENVGPGCRQLLQEFEEGSE